MSTLPFLPPPSGEIEASLTAEMRAREARTLTLLLVGRIIGPHGDGLCRVRNISNGGLMGEAAMALAIGEHVRIELRNGHGFAGQVRWCKNGRVGVRFNTPLHNIKHVLAEPSQTGRSNDVLATRSPRLDTNCSADLQVDGRHYSATLHNISQSGGRITANAPIRQGQLLTLNVAGLPHQQATVRWVVGEDIGLAFLNRLVFDVLAPWLDDPALRFNRRG